MQPQLVFIGMLLLETAFALLRVFVAVI